MNPVDMSSPSIPSCPVFARALRRVGGAGKTSLLILGLAAPVSPLMAQARYGAGLEGDFRDMPPSSSTPPSMTSLQSTPMQYGLPVAPAGATKRSGADRPGMQGKRSEQPGSYPGTHASGAQFPPAFGPYKPHHAQRSTPLARASSQAGTVTQEQTQRFPDSRTEGGNSGTGPEYPPLPSKRQHQSPARYRPWTEDELSSIPASDPSLHSSARQARPARRGPWTYRPDAPVDSASGVANAEVSRPQAQNRGHADQAPDRHRGQGGRSDYLASFPPPSPLAGTSPSPPASLSSAPGPATDRQAASGKAFANGFDERMGSDPGARYWGPSQSQEAVTYPPPPWQSPRFQRQGQGWGPVWGAYNAAPWSGPWFGERNPSQNAAWHGGFDRSQDMGRYYWGPQ